MEVKVISKELLINEEIREKEVRLIDSNGDQLGIVPGKKALEMAENKQLDLVMIAQQAKPPVCKIMDYSKYLYEISKKEKEAKKNQKVINIKEIRFSPKIEEHDLSVKANNAEKFLKDGDKVKVTVRFRGREADYSHIGQELLKQFAERLNTVGDIEKEAKLEGKNLIMVMKPKKEKA
jgi:translation initiation factor IF-3